MKKWPYADFAYLGVEHFRFPPQPNDRAPKSEYLTVEAVFAADSTTVMFFDHNAKEYKRLRSELDEYFARLAADGWKLTIAGNFVDRKS